ncbi:MAG: biotin-dependent carboxyltransferase [Desulfarculus sp.]|nr:MAG: biotin-dependent carboxyltransferase [Desulfarculus sp.]
MAATFAVIHPGVFSTVQAAPRRGFLDSGIPPSGPMDRFALAMGNLLLKNPLDEAGLEMTGQGVKLEVLAETVVALTGADMDARLNGAEAPLWQSFLVKPGDVLSLGLAKQGWRGYLCVAGGLEVPPVLGSKSTYTLGGLGGVRGRILKKGDHLSVGAAAEPLAGLAGRRAKGSLLPAPESQYELRVVPGPQDDHVRDESVETFLGQPYRVSHNSNRVGYRFEGPQLFFEERAESKDAGADPSNIVDDGNAVGAIQIPAGKEPICLGPDAVTMGGYVKIACLISADMDRLAQCRLRHEAHFQAVSVERAREILIASLGRLKEENVLTA